MPAEARNLRKRNAPAVVRFDVSLPGPVDVRASLDQLFCAGDDLVDRWDGRTLIRTVSSSEGATIPYTCISLGTVEDPALRVSVGSSSDQEAAEQAAHSTFIPAPPEFPKLLEYDPVLARLESRHPSVRQVRQSDLLAALVRLISGQQVNRNWARITRRRLVESFGIEHRVDNHSVYTLDAERLAGTPVAEIRTLQFTTRKAEYIVGVAEEIASRRLEIANLTEATNEEVIRRLTALRGIGPWTAEWILVRVLGRPRVVAGDLSVRKAVGRAYLCKALAQEQEVRQATSHWGASAGVAQSLLLHAATMNGISADTPA